MNISHHIYILCIYIYIYIYIHTQCKYFFFLVCCLSFNFICVIFSYANIFTSMHSYLSLILWLLDLVSKLSLQENIKFFSYIFFHTCMVSHFVLKSLAILFILV